MANIFKTMSNIVSSTKPIPKEDINEIPSYIFCRFLSGDMRTLPLALTFNHFHNEFPIDIQCELTQKYVDGKIKFIRYPSAKKKDNKDEEKLKVLMMHYDINETSAINYLEAMDKSDIMDLMALYKGLNK